MMSLKEFNTLVCAVIYINSVIFQHEALVVQACQRKSLKNEEKLLLISFMLLNILDFITCKDI